MSTVTHEQTIEDLLGARKLLTNLGWCKGNFRTLYSEPEAYCVVGSIHMQVSRYHGMPMYGTDHHRRVEAAKAALTMNLSHPYDRLSIYNDDEETVLGDILSLFDTTITKLEERVNTNEQAAS